MLPSVFLQLFFNYWCRKTDVNNLMLDPVLEAHVVLLEWFRIINHALHPVKIECDTVVIQIDLMSENSETL